MDYSVEFWSSFRYSFGPCTYLPRERELCYASARVVLPAQEAQLLLLFLRKPQELLTKREIAACLWPAREHGDSDRAINNLISRLRRQHPLAAEWIETIPKAGYRFKLEVSSELLPVRQQEPVRISTNDNHADIVQEDDEDRGGRVATVLLPALATSKTSAGLSFRRSWQITVMAVMLPGLVCAGLWYRHASQGKSSGHGPIRMAVVPFTGKDDALGESDTLRAQITDALASVPNVQVLAAHSMPAAVAGAKPSASSLNLDFIVAGDLATKDNSFVLNLEVIRSNSGNHLQTLHYEGVRSALGAIPDHVLEDLEPILQRGTGNTSQHLLGSTTNQEAYEAFFQAGHVALQRSRSDLIHALNLYKRALQLDSSFAKAWAGLAETQLILANMSQDAQTEQHFRESREAAEKALFYDQRNSQAHSAIGLILLQHDWQMKEAERHLRLAIQTNSGLAANYLHLAVLLSDEGRFHEAEAQLKEAFDVDPDWAVIHGTAMYVHLLARNNQAGIADAEALVRAKPQWGRAHQHLGWAFWYAGQHRKAIEEWEKAAELDGDTQLAAAQKRGLEIFSESGPAAYAAFRIAIHGRLAQDGDYVPAEWAAFAGDRETTLRDMEQMISSHDPESLKIPWNAAYDFVRQEPRYLDAVNRLGKSSRGG